MGYLGFLLLLLGAGGMDNENLMLPAVFVLVGLALVVVENLVQKRKADAHHLPK